MRAIKLVVSLLFVGVAFATSSSVRSKIIRSDPSAWLKEKIEKIEQ
jgi:hypothetical protein